MWVWVAIEKFNFTQVLHLCGMASVPKFNGTPLNFKATAKVICSKNWMFWYRNPYKLLVRSSRSFRQQLAQTFDWRPLFPFRTRNTDLLVNKPCESLHTNSATDITITQKNPFAVHNLPKFFFKNLLSNSEIRRNTEFVKMLWQLVIYFFY